MSSLLSVTMLTIESRKSSAALASLLAFWEVLPVLKFGMSRSISPVSAMQPTTHSQAHLQHQDEGFVLQDRSNLQPIPHPSKLSSGKFSPKSWPLAVRLTLLAFMYFERRQKRRRSFSRMTRSHRQCKEPGTAAGSGARLGVHVLSAAFKSLMN